MNPYQMRVCVDFNNVLWLCDGCLFSFRKQRSAPTNQTIVNDLTETNIESNVEHTVYQLQSEFASIKESFVELKRTLAGDQETDKNPKIPITSTPQRNCDPLNIPSLKLNDTSQLQVGSNVKTASTGSRKCWIFFTRVAKHVSTDDMRKMVYDSLQPNGQPEVVKLVPRWSNHENLRFISFKVGVDWKYKDKALMNSTWPAGLLFREFEHRASGYWEP